MKNHQKGLTEIMSTDKIELNDGFFDIEELLKLNNDKINDILKRVKKLEETCIGYNENKERTLEYRDIEQRKNKILEEIKNCAREKERYMQEKKTLQKELIEELKSLSLNENM